MATGVGIMPLDQLLWYHSAAITAVAMAGESTMAKSVAAEAMAAGGTVVVAMAAINIAVYS